MQQPPKKVINKSRNPSVMDALGFSIELSGSSRGLRVIATDKRVQRINDLNSARPPRRDIPTPKDSNQVTLIELHRACRQGIDVDVEFILKQTEFLNTPSQTSEDVIGSGGTCIHYAVLGDQPRIVALLVNQPGCRLDYRTDRGMTALHVACLRGHVECADELLKAGANMIEKDNYGTSSLSILSSRTAGDHALLKDRSQILSIYNKRTKKFGNSLPASSGVLQQLTDRILYRDR